MDVVKFLIDLGIIRFEYADEDWKNNVDAVLTAKNRKAEADLEKERQLEERKREKQEKANLRRLAWNYSCHVCGVRAKEPHVRTHHTSDLGGSYSTSHPDWDLPGDLRRCENCGEWTCFDHLHKDICKTCAKHH